MQNSDETEDRSGKFFGQIFSFNESCFDEAVASIPIRKYFDIDFRGKIVADVGCGYGRTSYEALKCGAQKVYAIDLSGRQLARVEANIKSRGLDTSRLKMVCNSATDISGVPTEGVDLSISLGVLHHLPSLEKGLDE